MDITAAARGNAGPTRLQPTSPPPNMRNFVADCSTIRMHKLWGDADMRGCRDTGLRRVSGWTRRILHTICYLEADGPFRYTLARASSPSPTIPISITLPQAINHAPHFLRDGASHDLLTGRDRHERRVCKPAGPHVAPPSGGEPVHCECFAITCSLEFSDDS